MGFFPRHILVGCIGGVGAFLIQTGVTVSMRIDEDDLNVDWKTFTMVFLDAHNLVLWVIPLALALLLRVITHKFNHQLIFPIYFLAIPAIFYLVVFAVGFNLGDLRSSGWIFDLGKGAGDSESWYKFYSYLDFRAIHFEALLATLPTQLALLFFNLLHPPLNVPALCKFSISFEENNGSPQVIAVSLDQDVDTDKELVAHGYSNIISGFLLAPPNYLTFYRVGGGTRIAGFLLTIMTVLLLVIGTAPIAYIHLVKEALWDTRNRTN
ncbi:hypothetical protein H0H93_010263, partial [Arthromyces matolae]